MSTPTSSVASDPVGVMIGAVRSIYRVNVLETLLVLPAESERNPAAMLTESVALLVGFRTSNVKCLLSPLVFARFCLVPLDTVMSDRVNVDVLIASPISTANGTGLAFVGLVDVDVIAGVGPVVSNVTFVLVSVVATFPAASVPANANV